MTPPVALDLFCAAGGMSAGLAAAGFEVVGVDIEDQPRYPFEFIKGDVFELAPRLIASGRFSVVLGSPTCNDHSMLSHTYAQAHGTAWQVEATRELFEASGLPYVIENVPGAPMRADLILCGSMFGLGAECYDGYRQLRRHRLFESNVELTAPGPCRHEGRAISAHGGGPQSELRKLARKNASGGYQGLAAERREALGTPWMTRDECSLAIPPAYGEHIGRQLLAHLAG